MTQRLLGPGLADAAGNGDDAGVGTVGAGTAEGGQCSQGVVDLDQGRVGCETGRQVVDDGRGGAVGEG